jgi:hypothetical protein
MNPRLPPLDGGSSSASAGQPGASAPAHFSRARPLLRRGLPYGPPWTPAEPHDRTPARGLIGQFFCASIEDQFEHLLCEWADRVPLGSPDLGGARDPLMGAHEPGDGAFEIPRAGKDPLYLRGLVPFTRTRGAAYLFYPSRTTLSRMAGSDLWGTDDRDDER